MPPVVFTLETSRRAESSQDASIIIVPTGVGPNVGIPCTIRSASTRSWKLGLAGDHVMAAASIGPIAVAHTEAKPTASVGDMDPREYRRLIEFMGGVTRDFTMMWVINRPGLPMDMYEFEGCIMSGDGGEERAAGSLPKTSFDVLVTTVRLNGLDIINGIVA